MAPSSFFEIEVHEIRRPTNIHVLKIRWFTSIKEIKEELHKSTNYPTSHMQIFHSSDSTALSNKVTLRELGIGNDGGNDTRRHVLLLSMAFSSNQYIVQPLQDIVLDSACKEMISLVRLGLTSSNGPSKTDMLDCTGGVYFMKSSNSTLAAVFKPRDEEQGMPNNPKGHAGNGKVGLREHFKPGKGFLREVAAYILDVDNFSQVPPTTIVHCEHPSFYYPSNHANSKKIFPKLGSLQKYIRASDTFEDISTSMIGVFEMQKIALLDIRILNCDRNSANILAKRKANPNTYSNGRRSSRSGSMASFTEESGDEYDFDAFLEETNSSRRDVDNYELIPIDHGYCLPTKLMIEDFDWVWFDCPQIAKPVDPEIKKYINSIDIDELIDSLTAQISVPEESLFLVRIVHQLLVEGIAIGLTLRKIAELIVRTEYGVPSALEKAISNAEDNAFRAMELRNGYHSSGSTTFSDIASPPRLGKSPRVNNVVHNILAPRPTRGDSSLFAMKRSANSELRLDSISQSPYSATRSVNTFSTVGYLSSENIQKLYPNGRTTTTSSSPNTPMSNNDYFMKDLSEVVLDESDKNEHLDEDETEARDAVTSLLSSRVFPKPGDNLISLQSLDSAYERNKGNFGSYFSAGPRAIVAQPPPHIPPQKQDKENGEDMTCSEASTEELGTSPRYDSFLTSKFLNADVRVASPTRKSGAADFTQTQLSSPERGISKTPSFNSFEVATTEPLNFDKAPTSKSFKDKLQTCYTSEEDNESGHESMASSPSEFSILDHLSTAGYQGFALHSLPRVVSFNAFESPAIYDIDEKTDRQFQRLKKERRRTMSKSLEFQDMRLRFTLEAIDQMVTRRIRGKSH